MAGVAGTVVATVLAGIATGWVNRIPGVNSGIAADPSEPFTTSVEIDKDDCSTSRYVPKMPSDIDFGSKQKQDDTIERYGNGWDSFTAAADGIPASPSTILLTIQGKTPTAVVLNRLDIRIVQRRPIPPGTILANRCGGALVYRWLAVDLDKIPPKITANLNKELIKEQHARIPPQNRQPISFPYKISSIDPEVFQINAETVYCDCEWVAALSWQSAGHSGTKIIDNHGKPFRTIGRANARYQCDGFGRRCAAPDPG